MTDLEKYVNGLFRHQKMTPELADMREEIISNMTAKRDDLIARGMDPEQAAEKARESLQDVDFLVDGNQLTDVGKYRLDCSQTVLLNCVIFWILSLPMLVAGYGPVSYAGLALVLVSGGILSFSENEPGKPDRFSLCDGKQTAEHSDLGGMGAVFPGNRRYDGSGHVRQQSVVRQGCIDRRPLPAGKRGHALLSALDHHSRPHDFPQFYNPPAQKQKGFGT